METSPTAMLIRWLSRALRRRFAPAAGSAPPPRGESAAEVEISAMMPALQLSL